MDTIAIILIGLFCSALGGRVEIIASESSGKSTHSDSPLLITLASVSNLIWLPIIVWTVLYFHWYWGVGGMIVASIACVKLIKPAMAEFLWEHRHYIRGVAVGCAVTLWITAL